MGHQENLRLTERAVAEIVDRVLTTALPNTDWTMEDALELVGDYTPAVFALQEALMVSAAATTSTSKADEYRRRAKDLPSNFAFFVETVIGSWKRSRDLSARPAEQYRPGGIGAYEPLADLEDEDAARSDTLGIRWVNLRKVSIQRAAVRLVPATTCRHYSLLPLAIDRRASPYNLTVAIGDADSLAGIEIVRLVVRCSVTTVMAKKADIIAAIDQIYG